MRAVLFDLDGTLLDIQLGPFLRAYFGAMVEATAPHFPGVPMQDAILASTAVMQMPHPGVTNRAAFNEDFRVRTGIDLDEPESAAVFEQFYAEVFPTLGEAYGPVPGAREAVERARQLGMQVVVATQPIFPRAAIEHRLSWAGLGDLGLELLTTYEVMHACKPSAEYFRETAAMAGQKASRCLMVGDDRGLDMPASDVGMRTFYVGDEQVGADWRGTMRDLPDLLERLAAEAED